MFEEEGALDKFEGFASEHGARFYGLPLNEGTVTLERAANRGAGRMCAGLVPFHAGQTLELVDRRLVQPRFRPIRSGR